VVQEPQKPHSREVSGLQYPIHEAHQSLPFSRLASRIYAAAPQTSRGGGREEGSVLGGLGARLGGDR